MQCRPGCAACCEAISISSPLPGLPRGKAAGVVCPLLNPVTRLCSIWAAPEYPAVCRNFSAHPEHCGATREEAVAQLTRLEVLTRPENVSSAGRRPEPLDGKMILTDQEARRA